MEGPTTDERRQIEDFRSYLKQLKAQANQTLKENAGYFFKALPPMQFLSVGMEEIRRNGQSLIFCASEYERLTREYFNCELSKIYIRTRNNGDVADPINLSWRVSNDPFFVVQANAGHNLAEIEISLGTIHALQDIALRAVSSENFLNPFEGEDLSHTRWQGGECVVSASPWLPAARYNDYTPIENEAPQMRDFLDQARANDWPPDHISRFVSKMPIDTQRLNLADAMVKIALTWMFCHEEAHFRLGHLSPSISDEWRASNANVLEWQADRFASTKTFNTYLIDHSVFKFLHPDQAASTFWRFRLLASSVGLAISLMDRDHLLRDELDDHPSPKLRLNLCANSVLRVGTQFAADSVLHAPERIPAFSRDMELHDDFLGIGYHLINGMISDVFTVLELVDLECKTTNRTEEHILLSDDVAASVLSIVMAWHLTGRVELRGGNFVPRSDDDEQTLSALMKKMAKERGMPLAAIEDSWRYASKICAETNEIILQSNEIVDYLNPFSNEAAMQNVLLKYAPENGEPSMERLNKKAEESQKKMLDTQRIMAAFDKLLG